MDLDLTWAQVGIGCLMSLIRFFADFGKHSSDYYELIRLAPAYRVFFDDFSHIDIPSSIEEIYEIFEKEEPGSSKHLKDFPQGGRIQL
jgi:phytoene dehydrogenase-like protein